MTPTIRELVISLFGAWRLAHFDKSGADLFDPTPEAAWRSFIAPVLALPAYALLEAVRMWSHPPEEGVALAALVQLISYVINVTAFPVTMHAITVLIGRAERYPLMVSVYNWVAVVQIALLLPLFLLMESPLAPDWLVQAVLFGAQMAMLTYSWFSLRTALAITGFAAAALVVLDLFLSTLINDVARGLV